MTVSRNLKAFADVSRVNQVLYKGNSEIVKVLNNLPNSEHDPFTFTVDLIYSTVSSFFI